MRIVRLAVIAAMAFLISVYYLWCARATGHAFDWGRDLGGYYNYLARAFTRGHLYVEIQPSPKLLALPDPYGPDVDDSLKMHDMALYRGHYYLYHGATPAVLLFTPWRLITGHDLPENFGLVLLCCAGFLFSTGSLLRVLALAKAEPSPVLLLILLLALGVCQCVPFLLSRIWVYEIAIGGGYCWLSAAVFCLLSSLRSARAPYWMAASGFLFGCAIGCRPHLGLAAFIATAVVLWRRQAVLSFVIPLSAAGLAIASYNYARFGNPFEFGVHYLMGNPTLNRTELAFRYVPPGLYYFVLCPPDFSPVFPWIRLAFRYSWNIAGYFLEPTAGCVFLAPLLGGLVLLPFARGIRGVILLGLAISASILLFIAGTGFTTQRYEVDFLPLAVLAGSASFAVAIARATGWRRTALTAIFAALVATGVITNLAIGLAGPYDDLLRNRPDSYMRIARRLSPIERYSPALNPPVHLEFTAHPKAQDDGFREPLLSMGHQTYREILLLEHHPEKFRLISQADNTSVAREIPRAGSLKLTVQYTPENRQLAVAVNGQEVLRHTLESLLTAPAQVTIGENRVAPEISAPRFTGRIE